MGNNASKRLRALLGPDAKKVKRTSELLECLGDCWSHIRDATDQKMTICKLERIEEITWAPPVLTFVIERHGGLCMGSTWGELQRWEIDLDSMMASWYPTGYRQVRKLADPVSFEKTARELAELVKSGEKEDKRIKWYENGKIHVVASKVFPSSNKKTASHRARRLKEELTDILESEGYKHQGRNIFISPEEEMNHWRDLGDDHS